ncbi:MAG: hypothetical protein JXD23_04835 [Spirochaetales bacterium]|nr:hypothetical protein [Spirochaetales bacterium]
MANANILEEKARTGNEGRYVLFAENISSFFLFGYCLCLSATILFVDSFYIKIIQFIFFCSLVFLTKKKRHVVGVTVVFFCTLLFHLIVVDGKAIFTIFGHPITTGAVTAGINRGLTIVTLFYMSKSLIQPALHFHGRIGAFLGKVFLYYDFFTNETQTVRVKTIWKDIDRLMLASKKLGRTVRPRGKGGILSIRFVFLYGGILFAQIILLILNYALFNDGSR